MNDIYIGARKHERKVESVNDVTYINKRALYAESDSLILISKRRLNLAASSEMETFPNSRKPLGLCNSALAAYSFVERERRHAEVES